MDSTEETQCFVEKSWNCIASPELRSGLEARKPGVQVPKESSRVSKTQVMFWFSGFYSFYYLLREFTSRLSSGGPNPKCAGVVFVSNTLETNEFILAQLSQAAVNFVRGTIFFCFS